MLVTALNPHIGYEKSAAIALKAHREGPVAARRRDRVGPRDGGAVCGVGEAGKNGAARIRSRNLERVGISDAVLFGAVFALVAALVSV